MKKVFFIPVAFAVFLLVCTPGPTCPHPHKKDSKVIIFNATSLNVLFKDLEDVFEEFNKTTDVIREVGGSRLLARKIKELGRKCDLMVSADHHVIEDILIPDITDWYVAFMTEKVVICYTQTSRFGNEITKDNWYEVLARDGVKIGRGDPNLDPVGYRTMLVWNLADIYYKKNLKNKKISEQLKEKSVVRPSVEIIQQLQNMEYDYIFFYEVVAKTHNLKYITLPDEINLGNPLHENFYKKASISVTGKKRGEFEKIAGSPIIFAFTIPRDAPNYQHAVQFIRFMLSWKGREIFEKNFMKLQDPLLPNDPAKLPVPVKEIILRKVK